MTLMSKKVMVPLLIENGFIDAEKQIGFEAFGRKVMAYIHVKDMETRRRLERFLISRGQRVATDYSPKYPVAEVQVSYFKAHHWDE